MRSEQPFSDGIILWLTGLSGAGKTSVAVGTQHQLKLSGQAAYTLDGDVLRKTLNVDLGFTQEDRHENIRRVGAVACTLAHQGAIVIVATISPYASDRRDVRTLAGPSFHEIYMSASLQTCEARDAKHLYARARNKELTQFTGISDVYEPPESPELILNTENESIAQCVDRLTTYTLTHLARTGH